ncbi:nucleotidyltransferase-like protein [Niallia taxi]|uniref:nucleotidyltransferase-like protein n=1 Tax=Niallia taxi TaxID=2499688 RepID=UPI00119CA111|nr:nucleotidyltransferase-like protein [Niallia taxi]MCT2343840.1 nucleotidyltransferase-like protein [Niallia taxi]MDE5055444.1 nucleotidyltransferase-like protein [Niallia taxi]MED3965478.1 nucleotidyltransferase-like protein [Niallia taxi]WOD64733.1 nucleotidyltransferase-like protein [Niallia taxi]
MEDILRPIYQERASQANTLGVLMIEKRQKEMTVTDTFDSVMLIIVKEADKPVFIKHYTYTDKKAALHIITETQLKKWILLGTNKKIFEWLYNGRVIFDRNEYVSQLKSELKDFPVIQRKRKMGVEFAKLIRRYMDGKAFFENKHYLDAYNDVVHSLHHLARLAVIENGFHPEVTVWSQVKQIEPEIYKLYVELINSEEPLEKRLELLFLASEFLIHSKTKMSIQHISDILAEQDYWSFNDLIENEELFLVYSVDLGRLIEYLIEKHFIEVVEVETKSPKVYHRYYKVSKKD